MRQGRRIGCAVAGAVLAALSALAAPAAAEEEGFTPIPVIKGVKSLEKGTVAPDFAVKGVDGKMFDFATEKLKRAHILVFWSIFCEPCREEMPIIEKLHNEYRESRAVALVAVNMDGEPFIDGIRGFLKQYKYTFPIVLDELNGEQFVVADPYQVAGTPVLYLVDAQGRIQGSHLGRIGEGDLKALIAGMLAAK